MPRFFSEPCLTCIFILCFTKHKLNMFDNFLRGKGFDNGLYVDLMCSMSSIVFIADEAEGKCAIVGISTALPFPSIKCGKLRAK